MWKEVCVSNSCQMLCAFLLIVFKVSEGEGVSSASERVDIGDPSRTARNSSPSSDSVPIQIRSTFNFASSKDSSQFKKEILPFSLQFLFTVPFAKLGRLAYRFLFSCQGTLSFPILA